MTSELIDVYVIARRNDVSVHAVSRQTKRVRQDIATAVTGIASFLAMTLCGCIVKFALTVI